MKFVVARHDDLPLSVFLCLEDLVSSLITVPSRGGVRVTGRLSSKDSKSKIRYSRVPD